MGSEQFNDNNLPLLAGVKLHLLEGKVDGDHEQDLVLQCVEEHLLEDRLVGESSWRTFPRSLAAQTLSPRLGRTAST